MILGNDHIVQWFARTGNPYWMAYHKASGVESGQYAAKSDEMENATNNTAMDDLRKWLAICRDGSEYILVSSPTPKLTSKGYQRETFEVRAHLSLSASHQVVNTPAVSGITAEDVKQQVDAALKNYKAEQETIALKKELDELKKENRELKKSVDEPLNRVIAAVSPHSEAIIAGIFGGPKAQVAGFPKANQGLDDNYHGQQSDIPIEGVEAPEEDLNPEQAAAVQSFVSVLASNDPDWVNTLNRMADKINSNPSVIGMLKNFL